MRNKEDRLVKINKEHLIDKEQSKHKIDRSINIIFESFLSFKYLKLKKSLL